MSEFEQKSPGKCHRIVIFFLKKDAEHWKKNHQNLENCKVDKLRKGSFRIRSAARLGQPVPLNAQQQ
jgi:hypothetical protein